MRLGAILMFRELSLQSTYNSYDCDIGREFYSPVLYGSVKYDRATAYFSAKALACYAKGLEQFARCGHKARFVISTEISEADYNEIRQGYETRAKINQELVNQLRESLSLEEEKELSNLAYLVALGVLDIKIAFTYSGIFHDKFGIVEDSQGNEICFRGSNNETEAAFINNYESFDITCSWEASQFDYAKITKSKETFEKLWNNQTHNVIVETIDDVVLKQLICYNRGEIVVDAAYLHTNCAILDYDGELFLAFKLDPDIILSSAIYRLKIKNTYVGNNQVINKTLRFSKALAYPDYQRIIGLFLRDSKHTGYSFFVSQRLQSYINEREMFIRKRANIGLEIKNKNPIYYERFEEFLSVVNEEMIRKLRNEQMWDAFFMMTMKKACNFSVPGSGKTASVYGVYAFLHAKHLVNKIIVVCPLSAFNTWVDEFKLCFGTKIQLKLLDIQTVGGTSSAKKDAIRFESGGKNLCLFNYEALVGLSDEIDTIINEQTLLVYDEVHRIKAVGGVRATYALNISRKANFIITMTGTPIPNSYSDISNLLDLLYHDEYNDFFRFTDAQLKRPTKKDIEEINEKLQPFFCRTTKRQLGVPDANADTLILAQASNIENRLFNILVSRFTRNKLVLVLRILQLESNPRSLLEAIDIDMDLADVLDVSGSIDDIDYVDYSEEFRGLIEALEVPTKRKKCIEAVCDIINRKEKTIVWCIFVKSINQITDDLRKRGIRAQCIYGATSSDDRSTILAQFKNGMFDVLVTNPHTLAESISLHQVCHNAVYFEYSYNLVHLLQSKDRIHRLGLSPEQETNYFYLMQTYLTSDGFKFSLGQNIYARLNEKEQTMLDAIEQDVLESGSTPEEDLDLIFRPLGL